MSLFDGKDQKTKVLEEATLLEGWARDYRVALVKYFAKRAPKTVEPDDLVQDVFMRLARRADLAAIENAEGYLFQTAASVLADRFRKDARSPDVQESFDEDHHGEAVLTPERVLIGRQTLDGFMRALDELPTRTRHIFVLYHLEHMRQGKIASLLGMPLSTVEKHMARATKHLNKRLRRMK